MNVSNIIVDFANANKEFRTNDLSEYLSGKIELSKKMLSWHLRKLLDEKKIFRISKGVYTTIPKNIFRPVPNAHSIRLYKKLKAVYPLLDFCVYNGEILSDLQHHLSYNNNIYIETERDATETIFHFVDIQCDRDFFYLQGQESLYMMQNAFANYNVNIGMLLRYASRRNIKAQIEKYIKEFV